MHNGNGSFPFGSVFKMDIPTTFIVMQFSEETLTVYDVVFYRKMVEFELGIVGASSELQEVRRN